MFGINAILSLFIGVPAIAGWIRYRRIQSAFYPFIWQLTLSFLNEILCIFLIYKYHNNYEDYNIFGLLFPFIIIYQLYCWRGPEQKRGIYVFSAILLTVVWIGEYVLYGTLHTFLSYSVIVRSFTIVLLSIFILGNRLVQPALCIYKDSISIICSGLILYFTYAAIMELFWLYGLTYNAAFIHYVFAILSVINLFTNILYLLAILWIPLKTRYLLQPLL